MSSATSIEKSFRMKADVAAKGTPQGQPQADNGFKAWHFFVLASLMMATVAVVMSRQATPEHLVLISITIGAAGAAAAAFYRMLAPLAVEDTSVFSEPLTDRSRAALEREKMLVLRSIKELEFDRAMGKLSPKDFDEMAGRLRSRALMLMKQLDEGGSGYRELIERELAARMSTRRSGQPPRRTVAPSAPAAETASAAPPEESVTTTPACPQCGTSNDADAAFCKRCGRRLTAPDGELEMVNGK
jgi:hypothetical protein